MPGLIDAHVHITLSAGFNELDGMTREEIAIRSASNCRNCYFLCLTSHSGGLNGGILCYTEKDSESQKIGAEIYGNDLCGIN